MADVSVFDRLKTKADFDREAEEFAIRRQNALRERSASVPAAIQEWQFYNQLPEAQKQDYLKVKRAEQILNLGGTLGVRNPATGGIGEQYQVTPKPQDMPDFKAAVEAEQARAKQAGETLANAGQANEKSRQVLDLIDKIEKDEIGMQAVVGAPNPFKGGFGIFNLPGTPAADFQAKIDQLGGKQFLEAFESLKGGGQITQIEGEKATNAIARMQTSQSEEAFRAALNEFRDIVLRASERANMRQQQAREYLQGFQNPAVQPNAPITTQPSIPPITAQSLFEKSAAEFDKKKMPKPQNRLKYNPETGEFE